MPAAIRANQRDANRIVDGALRDRLAGLKGVPVVVNQWASWCGLSGLSFPNFKALADRYAAQVAFLGLNSRDGRGPAERFLREFPVPYPNVFDGDGAQAREIGAGTSWPTTIFATRPETCGSSASAAMRPPARSRPTSAPTRCARARTS